MKQYQAYISLAAFSALVMFIEIIGAKLLTPILGGSQTVWISQILVTLLSLAVGGAISAKLKEKKIEIISLSIYISAIYLMTVLFFFHKIVPFYESLDFMMASLAFSFTLYTFPLISLGMIFPTLYIILEKDFKQNLGVVYFIGTIGSTIGTIATYFAVYFTSNLNLLLLAALFQIICIIFLNLNQKKKYGKAFDMGPMIPLVILAFFSTVKNSESKNETIYFSNSHFGEVLAIKNQNQEIIISSDGVVQNGFNSKNQSIHLFSYALERLPFYYKDNIKSTLMLGFGVGAGVNFLKNKNQKVTAVEINPAMIDLAKKLFPQNLDNVDLHIMDGRVFLNKINDTYDSILLDCFLVDFVPKYLLTKESFGLISKKLSKDGILTINSFGVVSPEVDFLTSSIFKTLKNEFKYVKVLSTNQWNVFFVASNSPLKKSSLNLSDMPSEISIQMKDLTNMEISESILQAGIILEDQSSKIEILDNTPRNLYRKKHKITF